MRALRKLLTPNRTGDRGATLVEYVLIAAVLVVGAIFAIRYMASAASSEQASQSECIGVRPAPADCTADFRVGTSTTTGGSGGNGGEVSTTTTALVTTTTTTTSTTTTTTAPSSTTTTPVATTSTTAAPTYSGTGAWYSYSRKNKDNSRWEGKVTVRIRDSSGGDVENADVVIRWRTASGGGTLTCQTDGDGRCDVKLTTSDSNQYIDFYIESVDGLPLSSPPAAQRVLQP